MIYRLNPELGIGRIIKILEIPYSAQLDEEDKYTMVKYKVLFENNLTKIIHPVDLVHYVFQVNEKIITKRGYAVVNSNTFHLEKGHLSYEVLFPNGKKSQIAESEIKFKYRTRPKHEILQQKLDPPKQFLLKYWANLFHSYYTSYQIKCITNSRLSLMPHQINVAHRLSEQYFPRMILADEVGLGKTIESGIYIKEMIARNLAERILIIVPATLVRQWQFEMENKFNIRFTIYDGKKIKKLRKKSTINPYVYKNPFYYDNLIICSLQFARNPKYIKLLSQISWDIVIFDEAHHLRRYLANVTTGNYRETLNYRLARQLSYSCESMLLLSATPLQLHSFELFSLIELIHPEAFENYSDFEHFRKNMPFINLLVSNLNHLDRLNTFELESTFKLLQDLGYVKKGIKPSIIKKKLENDAWRAQLLNQIEDTHTLSKYLIRNRKKNVFDKDLINERVVKTIMVHPTQNELDVYNEIRLYLARIYAMSINKKANIGLGFVITTLQKLLTSSKQAILKSLGRRLEQIQKDKELAGHIRLLEEKDQDYYNAELEDEEIETEYESYRSLHSNSNDEKPLGNILNQEKILKDFRDKLSGLKHDSKAETLMELLSKIYSQNSHEKIILFTQFVDTLFYLKELIEKSDMDIFVQTFYGGMDKAEKDAAVKRIKTTKKFAVLLSTEVGGEGRNFQFCRILINYDLPWNPMKLEQRIGRLDRIGQQSKEIYIYNFFLEGTIETDVIFALNKRINLFEESVGVLEPILGKIEKDFKNVIFSSENEKRKKLRKFNRDLEKEIQKAKEIELQLDDLLIDKKSFQMEGLISSLASCNEVELSHNELFLLAKHFFSLGNYDFGTFDVSPSGEGYINLTNEWIDDIPHSLESKYTGTFGLEFAKEREDIDFFALGHPLIDSIINYLMSPQFPGSNTHMNIKSDVFKKITGREIPHGQNWLSLFIYKVKFQGYIVENHISAVILDEKGTEIPGLEKDILNIHNFDSLFVLEQRENSPQFNEKRFTELSYKAKKIVKFRTSIWKEEVKKLNEKIFDSEMKKKEKLYLYNKEALSKKKAELEKRLERKKEQLPTERQKENIRNLTDLEKKQERLDKIASLKENISFLEKDIRRINKEIDNLAFTYDDMKRDMKKKNLSKYYTNILGFATVQFVD